MAKKRLKLLYLAQLFQEQTDEAHTVTVADMIAYLAERGVSAERKAIYEDLELLRLAGLDIVHTKTKTHNYYLGQRRFELPELKLLIDVVQASPFLTAKKSMELIGKLEGLASAARRGACAARYMCSTGSRPTTSSSTTTSTASTMPSTATAASAFVTLTGPSRASEYTATAEPGTMSAR